MQYLDCRRLTGPNLLWDRASVVLDVACAPDAAERLAHEWPQAVRRMCAFLGWPEPEFASRQVEGGISLAFDARVDRMYTGIAIGDWAWEECIGEHPDFTESASLIQARAAEEANPALVALQHAALFHDAPFLWDDDAVSLGYGKGAATWMPHALPKLEALGWKDFHRIPIGLVTGTNGKTTTARLVAHVMRAAGRSVGLTSTDGVKVNDGWLDRGDYSGPGGARMVLRHNAVQVAVLETARGGLLRRGLGVERADAALITNIAADHLGDFGSRTMQELLDIKWIVSRAVRDAGTLVLNADDPLLVQRAQDYPGRVVWFSLSGAEHASFRHEDSVLYHAEGGNRQAICNVDEIPLALGGAAAHNVANALAAAALCDALGVSLEHIRAGLTGMDARANPGRGNLYRINGVDVLVDFAHNPHAMAAIAATAKAWPAQRRLLAFGQAGDRPDGAVRELARTGWSMQPERVIYSEVPEYARGRAPGELFDIVAKELRVAGATSDQVLHVDNELLALDDALAWAQPGDLLVLLVLAHGTAVRSRLQKLETNT